MNTEVIYKKDRENFIEEFNKALDRMSTGYILVLSPFDTFDEQPLDDDHVEELTHYLEARLDENPNALFVTSKKLFQVPDRMCGIMFRAGAIEERLNPEIIYSYEADFLLRLMLRGQFLVGQDFDYSQGDPGDGNFHELISIYDKDWYIYETREFLIPLLRNFEKVPYLVQYFAMYFINCRLAANKNYNNRHALNESEVQEFRNLIGEALRYVDDAVIMSAYRYPKYNRDFQLNRMLLRFKYESMYPDQDMDSGLSYKRVDSEPEEITGLETYHHQLKVQYPSLFIMCGDIPVYSTSRLKCNIQLMDIKNGKLEIDGSVPDTFNRKFFRYFFRFGDKEYEPEFCERYSITKFFGQSAYKRYPFHISIPLEDLSGSETLEFYIEHEAEEYRINFEFKSHTSRLAAYPKNSYWHAGDYILTTEKIATSAKGYNISGIKIRKHNFLRMACKEIGIGWELISSLQRHRLNFFLLRAAWVVTYPFFGRKKIWLFMDKIYKGGDSSEYMYKYTCEKMAEKDEGAPDKAYYLLDASSSDYKRLKAEGYEPLRRGSFLHRLVFLNADVLVASNSTVFAFNDYYIENSRYIRGIPDFKVACVQHGLSVQKIAVAQNRLRDNTRMYFIASPVEQENLMKPVYDYAGYDAIKMTGIPRYDGLKNEDKKQIMISPTWRMQSAKLVSRHEGFERDYNPEFKETAYFKVYNSLINDEKLIAAAEKYGYRLKFVLHPIVSPQAGDFTSNEYVDIIPSVGDMSYEKMFRESSLMVTDYSGIQFDFAYMRKPLVYYHPDELEAHYEEGAYHYDTMAFGEIVRKKSELVELLTDYMKNGCEMKELYHMRADSFFTYNDHENCSRVYSELTLL